MKNKNNPTTQAQDSWSQGFEGQILHVSNWILDKSNGYMPQHSNNIPINFDDHVAWLEKLNYVWNIYLGLVL